MQGSDVDKSTGAQVEITRREFLATAASGLVALGAIGIGGFDQDAGHAD